MSAERLATTDTLGSLAATADAKDGAGPPPGTSAPLSVADFIGLAERNRAGRTGRALARVAFSPEDTVVPPVNTDVKYGGSNPVPTASLSAAFRGTTNPGIVASDRTLSTQLATSSLSAAAAGSQTGFPTPSNQQPGSTIRPTNTTNPPGQQSQPSQPSLVAQPLFGRGEKRSYPNHNINYSQLRAAQQWAASAAVQEREAARAAVARAAARFGGMGLEPPRFARAEGEPEETASEGADSAGSDEDEAEDERLDAVIGALGSIAESLGALLAVAAAFAAHHGVRPAVGGPPVVPSRVLAGSQASTTLPAPSVVMPPAKTPSAIPMDI